MQTDAAGLSISTNGALASTALAGVQCAFLAYRQDLPQRVDDLIRADPEFGFAYALRAGFIMSAFCASDASTVAQSLQLAHARAKTATPRERLHIAAMMCWAAGDVLGANRVWEQLMSEYPGDVIAFRFHHFVSFWLGRPESMLLWAEKTAMAWQPDWPFYGGLLACRAFANEECGHYFAAESLGRRSVEIDPGDPWGAHAVAHVLEMQGRQLEGIDWIASLQDHWHDRNNISHHLWWHQALYHLELGEYTRCLELYDRRFRNLNSPLTAAIPDLYIDMQNAISMLSKLAMLGVDGGHRWIELADLAEQRVGDCLSAFSVPHWMLALAAAERWDECAAMLQGVAESAARPVHLPAAVGALGGPAKMAVPGADAALSDAVLPVCEAIVHRARGEFDQACDLMRPVIGRLFRLGGSHAQQELFGQLYFDCAFKAGRRTDLQLIMARLRGRNPANHEFRRLYQRLN